MANHVIIGRGNVGLDLYELLTQQNHKAMVLTRSSGFSWPQGQQELLDAQPDCVWISAGSGSVDAAKKNFDDVILTHVTMPVNIMKALKPETKIVLFSSDYAADEKNPSSTDALNPKPRSLYAATKVWMEQASRLMDRPNTCVVRIGSIYGRHLYDKTFPGRVSNRYPEPTSCSFPSNWVCPTPSKWVADVLVRNYDRLFSANGLMTHHVAPKGGTTVNAWAKMILGEGYRVESSGFDNERPLASNLNCSLEAAPEWRDLWNSSWWK